MVDNNVQGRVVTTEGVIRQSLPVILPPSVASNRSPPQVGFSVVSFSLLFRWSSAYSPCMQTRSFRLKIAAWNRIPYISDWRLSGLKNCMHRVLLCRTCRSNVQRYMSSYIEFECATTGRHAACVAGYIQSVGFLWASVSQSLWWRKWMTQAERENGWNVAGFMIIPEDGHSHFEKTYVAFLLRHHHLARIKHHFWAVALCVHALCSCTSSWKLYALLRIYGTLNVRYSPRSAWKWKFKLVR